MIVGSLFVWRISVLVCVICICCCGVLGKWSIIGSNNWFFWSFFVNGDVFFVSNCICISCVCCYFGNGRIFLKIGIGRNCCVIVGRGSSWVVRICIGILRGCIFFDEK